MAKNIKGITIDISGDTTKLQKSLNQLNAPIKDIDKELKDLRQALKLDPSNTELLAQKQEVLKRNIEATNNKLEALKKAQKEMGDYASLTDEQKAAYNRLSVEIAKTESSIKDMNKELKNTTKIDLEPLKKGLEKVGTVAKEVGKKMVEATTLISGALAGLVGAGVKSYAELEQNIGGIETLYKENADIVIEYSKQAYKTAGVSANQYMEGVMSFSASLLQGLGGDTKKAAEVSDMAFKDMSDNANKFGTDMSSIQNAYQGFAKQNYTMLDNLKLGYGGTKKEMERLLKDAEKFSGVKYDINNLADVYSAIHVIQNELDITGTTAKEAEGTISGSVNSLKASFDNFLNGSGSPEQLSESIINVLNNISGAITKLAPNILNGVVSLIRTLLPQVIKLIIDLVPQLLDAITDLIDQVCDLVSQDTDAITDTITTLLTKGIEFIVENLPKILEIALILIETLAKGLIENLPMIIDSALQLLFSIIDTILDHLDEIIDLAIDLIITLATGLIEALPKLIAKVPEIITKLVNALTKPEMLLKILKASITLIVELAKGLIEALPELFKIVPTLISNIKDEFVKRIKETDWLKLGQDIIKGICDGFGKIGNYITNKVNDVKDEITNKFKKIFGIASPSKLMRDTIGKNISAGIGEGIEEGIPDILKDVQKTTDAINNSLSGAIDPTGLIGNYSSALRGLSYGIEHSVNPQINPNISINQNYQLMALAMKEALNDMEVSLDDREVGKFITKTITEEVYS